ncbi:MAG: ABC transporter permease subunit [Spirochaetales bacterium]|nr:ABC transporter permease subunit [Spirochaetales bacterium]
MNSNITEALLLSIKLSCIAALLLTITALPVAYYFSSKPGRWHVIPEFFFSLPLVFPPVILGFYLLLLFSPHGVVGKLYGLLFHDSLSFSFNGILFAAYVYGFPHMYRQSQAVFSNLDSRYTDLAKVLGKGDFRIFFTVILPQTGISLMCSVLFCFAHILGAFGVIVMVGGSIPGETKVASIMLFELVETFQYNDAFFFSLIMAGISLSIMIISGLLKKLAAPKETGEA